MQRGPATGDAEEPRAQNAVRRALVEVGAGAGDLASVTRPLLETLQLLASVESAYLTSIDWDRQVQRVIVAENSAVLAIEEGTEVAWDDTLCRRAMESGRYATSDVAATWEESPVADELGIRTYVSVPVVLADGEVYGTICGASTSSVEIDEQIQSLLTVFGRLVADTVARERRLSAASAQAIESERLLRARSQFVAAAQHRLKTPLTVIQGWSSILLDSFGEMADAERTSALQAIDRSARNALAEVSSMLSESQTEALARDVTARPIDVVAVAGAVADDLAGLSTRHRITVETEAEVPLAQTDPEALRIVLEHLVENAVKYSPDGGEVRIGVERTDAGRFRIAVCDEGIGLPVGVDIFAPFTRGVDRTIPGSGLGLHVVQSLVHAVSGEVTARRNVGRPGSTVSVILPPASDAYG